MLTRTSHIELCRSESGGTDEDNISASKLYQDAFLALLFKQLFETTAKQSQSKAMALQ